MPLKALHNELELLLELLDLVNRVPPSGLPDLGWPESGPTNEATITATWAAQVSQLDQQVQQFIGPVSLRTSVRWNMLKEAVSTVRKLAELGSNDRKLGRALATHRVDLAIDDHGKVVLIPNSLVQRVEGVEADRIRLCHCGRAFWAKRKDQHCCGKACANIRRVAKFRENYTNKYKLQRFRKAEKAAIPVRKKRNKLEPD